MLQCKKRKTESITIKKKISKEIAVRAIDGLDRVVLPCELRNKFDTKAEDKLQIFKKDHRINEKNEDTSSKKPDIIDYAIEIGFV